MMILKMEIQVGFILNLEKLDFCLVMTYFMEAIPNFGSRLGRFNDRKVNL